MLALTLVLSALIGGFFILLLTYCLRMGVVGGGRGPWQQDAHRDKQPIRYWTGIAGLALGTVFSIGSFVYLVWSAVI